MTKDGFYKLSEKQQAAYLESVYTNHGLTVADLARDLDVRYNSLHKVLLRNGVIKPRPKEVSDVKFTVNVNTNISVDLNKVFEEQCTKRDVTKASVLRKAVVDFVES